LNDWLNRLADGPGNPKALEERPAKKDEDVYDEEEAAGLWKTIAAISLKKWKTRSRGTADITTLPACHAQCNRQVGGNQKSYSVSSRMPLPQVFTSSSLPQASASW
jgi:hypothetical protein